MAEPTPLEHARAVKLRLRAASKNAAEARKDWTGLRLLMAKAQHENTRAMHAEAIGVQDCISCGSCGYVCPSKVPLVQLFYHAKGELWSRSRRQKQLDATRKLAESRAERIAREAVYGKAA